MSTPITLQHLLIASHNAGKIKEIEALLAPLGIDVTSAGALNLPEPEETGSSFEQNAALKANAAAQASHMPSLADDSGLCIEALDGAPGIYSARWAGENKDFTIAFDRIERELIEKNAPLDAAAYFICVLCLAFPDGELHYFEGRVEGKLAFPARGQGFGYNPVFIPNGDSRTFAEMEFDEKQAISHRARAFEKLVEAIEN